MGHAPYKGIKITGTSGKSVLDQLTLEYPLSICINEKPYTITMQTPGDELELALGLLHSEGLFKGQEEIPQVDIKEHFDTGEVKKLNITLANVDTEKATNSRSLLSVASCGICGQTEWKEVLGGENPIHFDQKINGDQIGSMFAQMEEHQSTFQKSGGSHAAAIFDTNQNLLTIKEDVGRHNAVDKVIGNLVLSRKLKNAQFLLVSGRISYEIVVKCFKARIPFLAAVSAPSSLAVDYAEELGITLIAFCRGSSASVYSHFNRLST